MKLAVGGAVLIAALFAVAWRDLAGAAVIGWLLVCVGVSTMRLYRLERRRRRQPPPWA